MSTENEERQLIIDTFDKLDQLVEKRQQQMETEQQLRRILAYKYLWPEAYVKGEKNPKILFAGGHDLIVMTMARENGETRRFQFKLRPTMKKDHPKAVQLPGFWGVGPLLSRWVTITVVEPEGLDIPHDIILLVLSPYFKQVGG